LAAAVGAGQRRAVAAAGRVRKMPWTGRRRRLSDRRKGRCLIVALRCCVVGWMVAAPTVCLGVTLVGLV
jgi:hypothetical protein